MERKKSELTRRDFLKLAGAAALFPVVARINKLVAPPSADALLPPEPVTIEGIRVFGHENAIQDEETLRTIIAKEEEEALPGIGNAYEKLSRSELIERRESVLPKNKRYIDVIIAESVYRRFFQIDGVENFPTWYKRYISDIENRLIREGVPGLDLEIVPRRIMVVADPLMEGYKIEFNPGSDKWHKDKFGRLPLDIDLRYDFGLYYLDVLGEKNFGPDGPLKINGKNIPYDNGIIHENLHGFFSLPDWYWYAGSIVNEPDYLQNILAYQRDIMSSRIDNITPATAVLIRAAVERFGFRSVFVNDLPENFIYREYVPEATVSFQLEDGNAGFLSLDRFLYTSGLSDRSFEEQHGNRLYEGLEFPKDVIRQFVDGSILLDEDALNKSFPYLLSVMHFPGNEGSPPLVFPIPRLLFRIAAWEKNEGAQFSIQFTDKVYPFGRQMVLETVWEKDLEKYLEKNRRTLRVFAQCKILNTGAVHIWGWRETDFVTPVATIVGAGTASFIGQRVAEKVIGLVSEQVKTTKELRKRRKQFDPDVRSGLKDLADLDIVKDGKVVMEYPDGRRTSLVEVANGSPVTMNLFEPTIAVLTDENGKDSVIAFPSINSTRYYQHYDFGTNAKNDIGLMVTGELFGIEDGKLSVARAPNKNYLNYKGPRITPSNPDGISWQLKKGLDFRVDNKVIRLRFPGQGQETPIVRVRVGKIYKKAL